MTRRPRRRDRGASALRAAFYAGGVVATGAGLHTAVAGARSLPGDPARDPVLESELRYYAAFYAGYGALLLRTAPRAHRDAAAVRGLAAVLFAGGLSRAAAWRAVGPPHPLQRVLLAVELGLPPAALAWQRRVARFGR